MASMYLSLQQDSLVRSVFFLTAANPFKGVLRLGLGLERWLAGRLAFLFVLFLICSGKGKRVGN